MKPYRKIPQVLTEAEIQIIVGIILKSKGQLFNKTRNAIMILLGFYLGLRPSEIRMARISDLNLDDKTIYIRAGHNKVRQDDTLYFPPQLIRPLELYLKMRLGKIKFKEDWLFPSYKGGSLDRSTFAKIFRCALEKLGWRKLSYIDKQNQKHYNFKPYSLRHSFCTKVYNSTADLKSVQIMARHRYLRSSEVYVHCNSEKRKEIMENVFKNEKQKIIKIINL